jgi:thiamine transport system permease protein
MVTASTQNRVQSFFFCIPLVVAAAVFLAACAAFILPLAAAVSPLAGASDGKSVLTPHVLRTALFTFKVAAGSTAVATAIGIPAAFFTANRKFPGRAFLLSLSAVPLCIPALIIALGFVSFFGMNGTCNRILMQIFNIKKPPLTFLYSYTGIIIAQGFYNFPLVMGTVSACWEQLPREEADAAHMLGADEWHLFRTITLYQIAPAVGSACIPVFLYSFFSFMIVMLFGSPGGSTLEVELYQSARTTLDFSEAARLALFETLCTTVVVTAESLFEQKSAKVRGISFSQEKIRPSISRQEYPAAFVLAVLILFFFLFPLIGIIVGGLQNSGTGSFTLSVFQSLAADSDFWTSVRNTIFTAVASGSCCTLSALVWAVYIRKNDPAGTGIVLRTFSLLPMAVSSIVTGFGMTLLVQKGTPALLVAAQTALTWPLAFRQIYTSLARLPSETEDAAELLSPHFSDMVYRIYLPYSARGIIAAFGFCFAVSAGDTTLPLVLAVPRFDTLSLYTYRLAGSYRFAQACACGAILGLLCALVFGISQAYMHADRKTAGGPVE